MSGILAADGHSVVSRALLRHCGVGRCDIALIPRHPFAVSLNSEDHRWQGDENKEEEEDGHIEEEQPL